MLMRRLRAGQFTVHGFTCSFRDWAAETRVVFEVAEASLAHAIGSNVTPSYLRTTMLERRRPIMAGWANFVCGCDADNVVPVRPEPFMPVRGQTGLFWPQAAPRQGFRPYRSNAGTPWQAWPPSARG